jgi:hypothetical protein
LDITRVEGTVERQDAGLYGLLPNIETIVVGAEVEGRYGRGRGFLLTREDMGEDVAFS